MSKHKQQRGAILPKRSPKAGPPVEMSPAAAALGAQLKNQTPDQLRERLIVGLLRSIELRKEPEFADFYFDDQQVRKALEHHVKRHQKRLDTLIKQNKIEEARELYDQLRIEIIAELMTPDVRRDLQERTDRCRARLQRGAETDKLELLVCVHSLLAGGMDQMLPLGICGLFTAIYEESHHRMLASLDAELELHDQIASFLPGSGEQADADQLLALTERPEVMAQITETVEAHPELRARMERDLDRMVEDICKAIRRGDIPASFFTDEEIMITYADVYNAMGGLSDAEKVPGGAAMGQILRDAIEKNLAEIITPERNRLFDQHLETIGHEMARSKNRTRQKRGLQLVLAVKTLDVWEVGGHPFLYEIYGAQAKAILKSGSAGGFSPEREALFRRLIIERGGKVAGSG